MYIRPNYVRVGGDLGVEVRAGRPVIDTLGLDAWQVQQGGEKENQPSGGLGGEPLRDGVTKQPA